MIRLRTLIFRFKSILKHKNPSRGYFTKYLFFSNVVISIGFSGLGDCIEQAVEILSKYKNEWNKTRSFKLAITGIPVGIICHYFYIFLDKKFIETTFKVIFQKVMLSQFICSPLCIISFYSTIGVLNKWSFKETIDNTISKGSKVYVAEWIVWPPAYVFSFYFLSTRHRVLYDNFISLGFNVFNSYIVHKDTQH